MDDAKTVWCGNLADEVTEELLYELFLQVGPLERVKIPTDREGRRSNFGFVTFKHEVSVPYAVQLLNGLKMFEKTLNIRPRNGGTQQDTHKAQQIAMQRSFSYPNDGFNQIRQNQHGRFNDAGDMTPQFMSFESLLQMGQLMNLNPNYQDNNYINHYGGHQGHNSGNHHGNNRPPWDRKDYQGKDRDRKEYDEPRNDYKRERGRRRDFSNGRNNNRRDNDHHNPSYDRNSKKRHHRRF